MSACTAQLKKLVLFCLAQAIVQGLRSQDEEDFGVEDEIELSKLKVEVDQVRAHVEYNVSDPCRVGASKVFTRFYSASETAGMAKAFCDEGGDASCMIDQYNYHINDASQWRNKEAIHLAVETCKHGGKDSCMSKTVKVYTKFYLLDKITAKAKKFCSAGGDGSCIIDMYNDFSSLVTKERIKAAACVCQRDHEHHAARRNALKVFTRYYDVTDAMFKTSACDMMETFLKEGGDASCFVTQFNHHNTIDTTKNAITIASGACSR